MKNNIIKRIKRSTRNFLIFFLCINFAVPTEPVIPAILVALAPYAEAAAIYSARYVAYATLIGALRKTAQDHISTGLIDGALFINSIAKSAGKKTKSNQTALEQRAKVRATPVGIRRRKTIDIVITPLRSPLSIAQPSSQEIIETIPESTSQASAIPTSIGNAQKQEIAKSNTGEAIYVVAEKESSSKEVETQQPPKKLFEYIKNHPALLEHWSGEKSQLMQALDMKGAIVKSELMLLGALLASDPSFVQEFRNKIQQTVELVQKIASELTSPQERITSLLELNQLASTPTVIIGPHKLALCDAVTRLNQIFFDATGRIKTLRAHTEASRVLMDLLRQFHGTVTLPETANALATLPFSHARNIASVLQEKSQQVPPDLSWDDLDQGQVNGILANQSNSLVIQAYNYCTDLQKAALQQADPHTIIPTNQLEILRNAYKTLCEYRTLHPEWDSTYRKIITQLEGMVAQSQKVYDQLYEPEYGLPRHLVQDPLWKALTPDEKKLICSDREKFVNVQARFIDRLDAKNKLATSLNLSHDLAQALNDVLYEIIGEEEQMGQIEKALSFCNSIPYVGTVKTENLFFDEYGISKLASPHAISGLQPIEIKDAEYIALVNNLVLCKQKAETLLDPQARHICLNSVDQAIRYLNTSAIQKTGFRFAQEVSNELTQLFNSKVAIFSELQNNQILTAGNFCEALPTAQQANLQQSVNRLLDRGLTLFSEVGADQQTKSAFVGFLNTVRELNKNNETEKALSILSAIDGLFGNISTQNPEAFGMVYHSNGINKIVTDNSMALAMPQSLGAPENVQARNLVNACLVMLETKAGDQEAIRNCLSWTLVGLHNPKLQGSYSVCAHFLFDSYSQSLESSLKNSAQAMLRCPDLSAALTSPDQIKAQADMTDLLAQGISKYSQPGAPQSADAELTSLIKVISTAQLDNLNGNTQKAVAAIASYQAEFKIEPRIQMTHDSIGAVQACEITTPEQQAAGKASSKPQSIPGQSSITSGSQIQNTPYALQEITDPESAAAETQEEAPAQGKAKPEAEKDKQTVPKAEPILQPKPKAEGKADGTPDAVNTNNGTITPQGPEDDIERKVNPKLKEMSDSELLRSKRSVERQLKEHQEKLKVYQENPDANDNQNFLKNAPSEIIRDQVIATRIRNLTGEIEKFAREINDIVQELIKRGIDG